MATSLFDTTELVEDLRCAVTYASRVGLLRETTAFEMLQKADESLRQGTLVDAYTLTTALNEVVRLIAPITIADLRFGRDPLARDNQEKGRKLQVWLTGLALVMLMLIGYFMQSLREEQEAIQIVGQIQDLQPQQKLTALRKMAQFEKPFERPTAANDAFHQKVGELKQINDKLGLSITSVTKAWHRDLFPFQSLFLPASVNGNAYASLPVDTAPNAQDTVALDGGATASSDRSCEEEVDGALRLPDELARTPPWMRSVLTDTLSDYCFQLKVMGSAGDGAFGPIAQTMSFLPELRQRVSTRLNWFLPFFYGVLGSIIFALRNTANVRTPSVEWFSTLMRIGLGGIAGIVIGWFGTMAAPGVDTATSLSLPFVMAFIVGYWIELLFNLLDKLSQLANNAVAAKT